MNISHAGLECLENNISIVFLTKRFDAILIKTNKFLYVLKYQRLRSKRK